MRTVTAAQLIEELQDIPPDAQVAFSSDYGDYVHTQQVHFLRGNVEETPISKTAYSCSGYAVANEGEDTTETVYLIS